MFVCINVPALTGFNVSQLFYEFILLPPAREEHAYEDSA